VVIEKLRVILTYSGWQVIKNGDPYPSLKNGVLKLVSPTAVILGSADSSGLLHTHAPSNLTDLSNRPEVGMCHPTIPHFHRAPQPFQSRRPIFGENPSFVIIFVRVR
jgi:hypothetical protein